MQLQAANGSSIQTFGRRADLIELSFAKSFPWKCIIAEVTKPIIGCRLLASLWIVGRPYSLRLIDAETFLSVPTAYRRSDVSWLCAITSKDEYSAMPEVFKDINKCRLQGKVQHHIDTHGCRPVFARAGVTHPTKLIGSSCYK